jgi:hypothetical protein
MSYILLLSQIKPSGTAVRLMSDFPSSEPSYKSRTTFNPISRVLSKHNIKIVGLLSRKLSSFLRPVKDDLALKTPDIYSIPSGKLYTGQTGRSIEMRIKEHR